MNTFEKLLIYSCFWNNFLFPISHQIFPFMRNIIVLNSKLSGHVLKYSLEDNQMIDD